MPRTLALTAVLISAGCGSGPSVKGPGLAFGPGVMTLNENNDLVGFWFLCQQQPCANTGGFEFEADGTLDEFAWDAKQNAYCQVRLGTYTWDGTNLTTSVGSYSSQSVPVAIAGDTATSTQGNNSFTLARTYLSDLATCPSGFSLLGQ